MRQNDLAWEVRDYLKAIQPRRWSTSDAVWTAPEEPATTEAAKSTIWIFPTSSPCAMSCCPPGREENIPCNLNDTAWFSQIDASGGAVFFFASGVFYYFLTEQVKALVQSMAGAFRRRSGV